MGDKTDRASLYYQPVTIASGQSVSSTIDAGGLRFKLVSVEVPAEWTAADIGFQVSRDGTTFAPLFYDADGTRARVKIAQVQTDGTGVYIAPAEAWALSVYPYFRLESLDASDESAEDQGAARTLYVGFLS